MAADNAEAQRAERFLGGTGKLGSAGAARIRKTFEAGGNRKDEYPMCTTM